MKTSDIVPQGQLNDLYSNISQILSNARQRAYAAVNFAMVECYWLIGQQIVEHEQNGASRADYGKGLLRELAARLSKDFGKGFDESNLRYMRLFYRCFPKRDTLRHELSWSHYRRLISVEDKEARQWYMNEAADRGRVQADVGDNINYICPNFNNIDIVRSRGKGGREPAAKGL